MEPIDGYLETNPHYDDGGEGYTPNPAQFGPLLQSGPAPYEQEAPPPSPPIVHLPGIMIHKSFSISIFQKGPEMSNLLDTCQKKRRLKKRKICDANLL